MHELRHRRIERDGSHDAAGRKLLGKFPDHLETLENLAELYSQEGDYAEELKLLLQAQKHNLLDRDLRADALLEMIECFGRLSIEAHLDDRGQAVAFNGQRNVPQHRLAGAIFLAQIANAQRPIAHAIGR